ncbi:MAG: glycosyltransferase family 2 protein [Chitinophagales bacterium]|nr:glycosyltransferase family 2 protein [Chitinophagales bacterium]MDW8419696.1 glycosyltransferase family 2 protein [Chitinophagales bacterium]
MKVTGFSFIRNAIRCDYPICEAIRSILPVCDEVVVAVGESDDGTLDLVRQIHPAKVLILPTVWDENLRTGGRVFAAETDKAFHAIGEDTDWCFYIQADEVVHENSLNTIHENMKKYLHRKQVEGLLFDFIHFWGSYRYVVNSPHWHKREIRIIRNDKRIFSYKDSMGFRKMPNRKLRVLHSGGIIYHYGHVKPPHAMMQKSIEMDKQWHDDAWISRKYSGVDLQTYDYGIIEALDHFEGTHPAVMQARIAKANWVFTYDTSQNKLPWKQKIKQWIYEKTGWEIGTYKNYILLKDE